MRTSLVHLHALDLVQGFEDPVFSLERRNITLIVREACKPKQSGIGGLWVGQASVLLIYITADIMNHDLYHSFIMAFKLGSKTSDTSYTDNLMCSFHRSLASG